MIVGGWQVIIVPSFSPVFLASPYHHHHHHHLIRRASMYGNWDTFYYPLQLQPLSRYTKERKISIYIYIYIEEIYEKKRSVSLPTPNHITTIQKGTQFPAFYGERTKQKIVLGGGLSAKRLRTYTLTRCQTLHPALRGKISPPHHTVNRTNLSSFFNSHKATRPLGLRTRGSIQ